MTTHVETYDHTFVSCYNESLLRSNPNCSLGACTRRRDPFTGTSDQSVILFPPGDPFTYRQVTLLRLPPERALPTHTLPRLALLSTTARTDNTDYVSEEVTSLNNIQTHKTFTALPQFLCYETEMQQRASSQRAARHADFLLLSRVTQTTYQTRFLTQTDRTRPFTNAIISTSSPPTIFHNCDQSLSNLFPKRLFIMLKTRRTLFIHSVYPQILTEPFFPSTDNVPSWFDPRTVWESLDCTQHICRLCEWCERVSSSTARARTTDTYSLRRSRFSSVVCVSF